MSGLDGAGGGAPTATATPAPGNNGTGGEDVRVNTSQQASDALDARIAAKREAAERGEQPTAAQAVSHTTHGSRGPDGKFLPRKAAAESGEPAEKPAAPAPDAAADVAAALEGDEPVEPKAAKDPEIEKLKAEHQKATARAAELERKHAEWEAASDKILARFDRDAQRIAYLEEQLAAAGGQADPTFLENLTLKERLQALQHAEERAAEQAERQRVEQAERQRAEAREALTSATRAALEQHPELQEPAHRAEFIEALRRIHRGADPADALELASAKVAKKTPPVARTTPPRTLAGMGAGSGGPKLTDIEDIREKWKRALPVPA